MFAGWFTLIIDLVSSECESLVFIISLSSADWEFLSAALAFFRFAGVTHASIWDLDIFIIIKFIYGV